MSPNEIVILADADNTLWDSNAVFANAQLKLLSTVEEMTRQTYASVERLDFVRSYDQALATHHHLHLKYPPHMLATAIAAGLSGGSPEDVAIGIIKGSLATSLTAEQTEVAVSNYLEYLKMNAELLPGVAEGTRRAKTLGVKMYVMTEGRIEKQRSLLTLHNLNDVFSGVWELNKTKSQFDRLRRRFEPREVFVIGDQPDRDIVPAHESGCKTVLIPGKFQPKWNNYQEKQLADFVAIDFDDAIIWIASQIDTAAG